MKHIDAEGAQFMVLPANEQEVERANASVRYLDEQGRPQLKSKFPDWEFTGERVECKPLLTPEENDAALQASRAEVAEMAERLGVAPAPAPQPDDTAAKTKPMRSRPRHEMTSEEHNPNESTAAYLFQYAEPILTDGAHELTIEKVTGGCGRTVRLHVRDENDATAEVPIGVPGSARLRKHLRLLLGTSEVDDIEAALVGKRARLKVGTWEPPGGRTLRTIERAR